MPKRIVVAFLLAASPAALAVDKPAPVVVVNGPDAAVPVAAVPGAQRNFTRFTSFGPSLVSLTMEDPRLVVVDAVSAQCFGDPGQTLHFIHVMTHVRDRTEPYGMLYFFRMENVGTDDTGTVRWVHEPTDVRVVSEPNASGVHVLSFWAFRTGSGMLGCQATIAGHYEPLAP